MSIFLSRLERSLQAKAATFSFRDLFFIMLALHLFILSTPPTDAIWDENIYSLAAISFLNGQASYIEHPFLGYFWIASGTFLCNIIQHSDP
ncbi:MAG: hypothetical protein FJ358_05725 [Thaumarchaeota archaeon]|nr:hypothetical protein [Nitrososphaerota archaeon]